jgi:hypothetical protein
LLAKILAQVSNAIRSDGKNVNTTAAALQPEATNVLYLKIVRSQNVNMKTMTARMEFKHPKPRERHVTFTQPKKPQKSRPPPATLSNVDNLSESECPHIDMALCVRRNKTAGLIKSELRLARDNHQKRSDLTNV